jgi:hypothetical protein
MRRVKVEPPTEIVRAYLHAWVTPEILSNPTPTRRNYGADGKFNAEAMPRERL